MTRVHHARPQYAPQSSLTFDQPRAVHVKKKPYKIVLEAVTQEKKKLNSILTYASNAPTGFGFVPAGHPDITEWCKEQCRQRNLDVHIVSAKPKNKMHADPEKLSHHVHRVGHHFPLEIVKLACSKFGYTYNEAHGLRKVKAGDRTNWIAQHVEAYSSRQMMHGRPSTEKETKDYIHGAVREMFPKIPEADLSSIVNHAFEEGTDRVGNAKELSLARRVQLAVVAHIRHTYTDYDKLLKSGGWMEARSKVEHVSLAKLKEWRDEAGEPSDELEETFREVIVLDDDEASSDGDSLSTPDEREQSMEIVSSRATARDLQPELYAESPRIAVQDARRVPRRTIIVQRYPTSALAMPLPGSSHSSSVLQPPFEHRRLHMPTPGTRPPSRDEVYHPLHGRPIHSSMRPTPSQPSPKSGPIMREIDGRLYELQPIEEPHDQPRVVYDPPPRAGLRYAQEGFVQSPLRSSTFDRPGAHSRRTSEQEVVLPSVEREAFDLTSPHRGREGQWPLQGTTHLSRGHMDVQFPQRKFFPSSSENKEARVEHNDKRMRPVYRDNDIAPQAYQVGPPHHSSYLPMDPRMSMRPQPPRQVVDLTSSPYRPSTGVNKDQYVSVRPHVASEPHGHAYISVPSSRSPLRETRGAYFDTQTAAAPHTHIPNQRMYERRAPPAHDIDRPRDVRSSFHVGQAEARTLRSGVRYGG